MKATGNFENARNVDPAVVLSDKTRAHIAHGFIRQPCIGDRVAHGDIGVRGRIAHEAFQLAVDLRIEVDVAHASHLAAKAELGVFGNRAYAAAALAQCIGDAGDIVAQRRNHAHASDNHAPHWTRTHQKPSVDWNRPTRRSFAS